MKINVKNMLLAMANECMTIGELSTNSDISRTALNNITNQKTNPKPATIGKIAKALNVKVEYLIESDEGAATPNDEKTGFRKQLNLKI